MNPFWPHLAALPPIAHGGAAQLAAAGFDPDRLLDFSASTLPGGPPPSVGEALAGVPLERYPDPRAHALRAALARHHGCPADHVLPANGSVELIRAVALAALRPGDRALIVGPTFGEYAQAVRVAGGEPCEIHGSAEVLAAIDRHEPRLVFVCNPNNPTGYLWEQAALDAIARKAFLVLDEAYAGFLDRPTGSGPAADRLLLRSMTKDCGLAGLRLGYALASPAVLSALEPLLVPWGVNAFAQAAGLAALAAHAEIRERLATLRQHRTVLLSALRVAGWEIAAGEAPFFLVRVGSAAAAARRLLDAGIVVRDATSFGLPEWIRISPRSAQDNARLLAALNALPRPTRQEV